MNDLCNKTALVTGASRGIGRAAALSLAAAGARVIVHYGRGEAEAKAVIEEIRAVGGTADVVGADLAAPDGAHKLAEQVKALAGSRLDILVANAGISHLAKIEDQTVENFDRLYAINVRTPYFLVQQLLPVLGQGSSVIFVSSVVASAFIGDLSAYASTKGAVNTLVRYFASSLGERGIRVNALAPGVIETEASNFTKTDVGREKALGMQALKRIAQPDDISGVFTFLASDAAKWVTGEIIHASGGSNL